MGQQADDFICECVDAYWDEVDRSIAAELNLPPENKPPTNTILSFDDNNELGDRIAKLTYEQRKELAAYLFDKYGIIGE